MPTLQPTPIVRGLYPLWQDMGFSYQFYAFSTDDDGSDPNGGIDSVETIRVADGLVVSTLFGVTSRHLFTVPLPNEPGKWYIKVTNTTGNSALIGPITTVPAPTSSEVIEVTPASYGGVSVLGKAFVEAKALGPGTVIQLSDGDYPWGMDAFTPRATMNDNFRYFEVRGNSSNPGAVRIIGNDSVHNKNRIPHRLYMSDLTILAPNFNQSGQPGTTNTINSTLNLFRCDLGDANLSDSVELSLPSGSQWNKGLFLTRCNFFNVKTPCKYAHFDRCKFYNMGSEVGHACLLLRGSYVYTVRKFDPDNHPDIAQWSGQFNTIDTGDEVISYGQDATGRGVILVDVETYDAAAQGFIARIEHFDNPIAGLAIHNFNHRMPTEFGYDSYLLRSVQDLYIDGMSLPAQEFIVRHNKLEPNNPNSVIVPVYVGSGYYRSISASIFDINPDIIPSAEINPHLTII